MNRLVIGLGVLTWLLVTPGRTLAHHLEESLLELRPVKNGQVRGRFLLAPRAFPLTAQGGENALSSELRAKVELSVAGAPCTTPFIPVEVWSEASPSPGHLVDLSCPVPEGVHAPRVEVLWRGPADLLVTYPPTQTTGAVNLRLAPNGRGNLLATEALPTPNPALPRPTRPTEPEPPKARHPLWLDLSSLSLFCVSLATLTRVLDARWARADRRRYWLIRAAALSLAAAGLGLFAARVLTG